MLLVPAAALAGGEDCGAAEPPVVLVLGDSLSAAYGIERSRGWVRLLQRRLRERGFEHEVVNASISGDTSAGGRARLPRLLERHAPQILIAELGGNDGLRGVHPDETRANLEAIIERAQASGAKVLLVPVRMPPNYGRAFIDRYLAVFRELGEATGVAVSEYLMRGVAEDLALMQPDGIHPRAAAQPRLLENVWPALEPLLEASR